MKHFLSLSCFIFFAFGCKCTTNPPSSHPGPGGTLVGARGVDETAINHETKECIRFNLGGACSSCNYTVQEGWVLAGSEDAHCPTDYKNLTDELEEKRRGIQSIFKEAFQMESVVSPKKPNLKREHKEVVDHKTKRCLGHEFNYYPRDIPNKGWEYSQYTPKEGWVYIERCPSSYTYYDDKKLIEDYNNKTKSQAVKCDKPREVPKCCKEPPYCV